MKNSIKTSLLPLKVQEEIEVTKELVWLYGSCNGCTSRKTNGTVWVINLRDCSFRLCDDCKKKLLLLWGKKLMAITLFEIPEVTPRRPLDDDSPKGYQESDKDFILNNLEAAVFLLENIEDIKNMIRERQ